MCRTELPLSLQQKSENYLYLMVDLSVMQWAEVLSADAFSAFEDAGLDNNKVYLILVALNALTLV
jgi:hypothetical protein